MNSFVLKASLKLLVGVLIVTAITTCDDAKNGPKPVITNQSTEGNMKNKTKEDLVPWFIPSLSAILLAAEKEKGKPLTENEVLNIRDNSQTIMTPRSMIESLVEKRGYEDLNPDKVWSEWQLLRKTLDTGNEE